MLSGLLRPLCVTVVILPLATPLMAQPVTNFAGTWNIISFSTPSRLTLQRDPQGLVIGIPETAHFERSTGILTVLSNGTFSGAVPDPISGSAAPGGQGEVVLTFDGTDGPPSITFNVNEVADVMTACGSLDEGFQDLILALRAPELATTNELAGLWNITSFQTPYQLDLEFDSSNKVTNVRGLSQFQTYTGTMTVNSNGTFSGFTDGGAFTGTVNGFSGGSVNVTVNSAEETNSFSLFLNASKDLMALVSSAYNTNDNYQEVMLFSRAPTNTPAADLAGRWQIAMFDTPQLVQVKNGFGQLTALDGAENFESARQSLAAGYDGFFLLQGGPLVTGTFSGSSGGLVNADTQSPDGPETISFQLNASRMSMASARTAGWGHELLLLSRSAAVPGTGQNFGLVLLADTNSITLEWAAATNAALQISSDFTNWVTLSNTLGQHSYSTLTTNTGSQLFRVVQPAP